MSETSIPLMQTDSPGDVLEELVSTLRKAKREYRLASEAKATVLRQLSLAEIAERKAREAQAAVELRIYSMLGEAPPKNEVSTNWHNVSWDEVWCPRCKHTFLPSQPGGKSRG